MSSKIHPTALVAQSAKIADGVEIGPYCVVGAHVSLSANVRLLSHVSVDGHTSIGEGSTLHPFSAIGQPPQDFKYRDEATLLRIGKGNVIREHVTMHTGTVSGRGETVVGDNCFFMTGSHVAHDCIVGNHVVFANNATLGGRVDIGDYVTLGGLSAVHQLGRVGPYAFIGGGAPVTGDVIPFGMVDNHGALHGLNLIGLQRRGFGRDTINTLRKVYRLLFKDGGRFSERLAVVRDEYGAIAEIRTIIDFIDEGSKRPLCLPERAD